MYGYHKEELHVNHLLGVKSSKDKMIVVQPKHKSYNKMIVDDKKLALRQRINNR